MGDGGDSSAKTEQRRKSIWRPGESIQVACSIQWRINNLNNPNSSLRTFINMLLTKGGRIDRASARYPAPNRRSRLWASNWVPMNQDRGDEIIPWMGFDEI